MILRKIVKERILVLFYYTPPVPLTAPDMRRKVMMFFACVNEWLS